MSNLAVNTALLGPGRDDRDWERPSLEVGPPNHWPGQTSETGAVAIHTLSPLLHSAPFTMAPIGPAPPDVSGASQASRIVPRCSRSNNDAFSGSDDRTLQHSSSIAGEKSHGGKHRWFTHVKDWLSVSEPSAHAMKTQKRNVYQKHGVDLADPRAAAKMHFPMSQMPAGAITSTRGPDPEDVVKRKAKEKRGGPVYSGYGRPSHSHSISSGMSSTYSRHEGE